MLKHGCFYSQSTNMNALFLSLATLKYFKLQTYDLEKKKNKQQQLEPLEN